MNTVSLIGRPNTGKSSLFNRLIKEKKSIIMDNPGITRDRIYGKVTFNNKTFHLIDTGGIDLSNEDWNDRIKIQAEMAIEESDVVVFVVDGLTDITENDRSIASILQRKDKKVIVAVNKIDNESRKENVYSFYELGFEKVMPISVEHKLGIDELLKEITSEFNENPTLPKDDILRFSFIGRPNTGKSSLTNALLNEERVIVSDVAGTTRDAIDTKFNYEGEPYIVVDTAGLRKKGKIFESVEKYSLIRTLKAIEESDVCVLVINAEEGIIEHDKHIASYALDAGKCLVIAVNKWDTVKDQDRALKEWKLRIRNEFQFATFAPIVFLSALTKKRIHTLMPAIISSYENATREIKTSVLNDVIGEASLLHPAPSYKGRRLKIYFVNQSGTKPPKFTFSVNNKGLVHFSYERYLENTLRNNFELEGTPIVIQFKNKNDSE
ncbi:MAG: ribosome biogenesis GTPase Der [Bacilli bacterium]|nr:ribosome biogenesis GTPase Der [Bacilli bacterium]